MKKVIRLTESDLTRIIKRVIKEQEEVDVKWDIKSVECGENKTSGMVDVKIDGDEVVAKIRYCKGDDEDKEYLKKKALKLIEKKYSI